MISQCLFVAAAPLAHVSTSSCSTHKCIHSHAQIDEILIIGSNLAEYVRDTKEVTRWYALGVQLGIKASYLKELENNHKGDTERCRIDMLEHWLNNDSKATRSKLAEAVKNMGGHAKVVETLKANLEGW